METDRLKALIESLLFASEGAVTVDSLARVIEGVERAEVRSALKELAREYDEREGGIFIEEVAGGFQFRTRPDFAPWIRRLVKGAAPRLTRPALETLAIVAYRQPVTRGEVESIRGVDSAGVLATLIGRNLIKIAGRKDTPGRPVVYSTTKEFLEVFDLKDLSSLPALRELEALEEENAPQEERGEGEASEGDSHGGGGLEAQGRRPDEGGPGEGERPGGNGAGNQG